MTQEHNFLKLHKKSMLFFILKRGNYYVKDLNDVLTEPHIRPSDFIYTKFLTTLVLIIPTVVLPEFKKQYEMWTNNVIPGSAERLNVPEKDGLQIW